MTTMKLARKRHQDMIWRLSFVVMRFKIALKKCVGGGTADDRHILRLRGSLRIQGLVYNEIKREKAALDFVIPFL